MQINPISMKMAGVYLVLIVLLFGRLSESLSDTDIISRISKLEFPQGLPNKTVYGRPVIKIPPFGRLPGLMQYVPKGKQLKEKRLRRRLGNDFDEFWMSVQKPIETEKEITVTGPNHIRLQILEDIENFTKSYKFQIENTTEYVDETVSFFRRMMTYGSCKVEYEWEDLSVLFWPRWVKRGSCNTEVSCSFPSGMYCASARSKVIKLLRWTCKRKRKGSKRRKNKNKTEKSKENPKKSRFPGVKCRWKKVPYPVTDACVCSC
ncbi:noggin-2-like isoform X1 [Saccostrea cucullata]|uniref:noggin-2-like isoform X1 n=2 Tax=Saccostrea cuccullata TaxID=36930 RepID=UPI002ED0ADC4